MKSILMSVKPEYVAKILNVQKTVEISNKDKMQLRITVTRVSKRESEENK